MSVYVDEPIKILLTTTSDVSLETLRDILTISKAPAELPTLNNPKIASACIRLLQQRQNSQRILKDEYSILCLKIIAIYVQVMTLSVCETLNAFIGQASSQSDAGDSLARFAVTTLYTRTISNQSRALLPAARQCIFLDPYIPVEDTKALIECLYQERDDFLLECSTYPDRWSGWSFILYPAWFHFLGERFSDPMTIAPLLGDLLFRFAAAEFFYYDEGLIVEFMLSCTHARVDKKGRGDQFFRRAASLKDSEVAIRAIANKFYSGSCSLNLAYELHTWAGSSGIPGWLDSMIPLAKAALARLWHALDPQKESLPLTYERLSEVAQFARLIFEYIMFLMISANSKATISQATKADLTIYIIKEDLFGLLARVLVFPLSCNHSSLSQPHQQSLDSIYNNVFRIFKETGDGLAKICPTSVKEILDSHIDWLKAAQYFEAHCHLYGKGQFVNTYVPKCHVTWKRLGSSLLGKQLKDLSAPCSYPRCPYPAPLEGVPFICGGCQTTTYCSHQCRHSH